MSPPATTEPTAQGPLADVTAIAPVLVEELALPRRTVDAVIGLLDGGATVPFIARYRKEATGGLDEVVLRTLTERLAYLRELEARKKTVLAEIEGQGKLTAELRGRITGCRVKADLEDLYLPFKPKRRTRATIARERGLAPLAERMLAQPPSGDPRAEATAFVNAELEVADVDTALAGARDICAEVIAENPDVRRRVRETFLSTGVIQVKKTKEHADRATKFDTYAAFEGAVTGMPSHRFLAIRRGESEGVLHSSLTIDRDQTARSLMGLARVDKRSPFAGELEKAVHDAFKRLVAPSVEIDVRVELKLAADRDAVGVFADNLRELLLAAPFGTKTVLGIDPGQRTGCKCAVVDETGKLLEHTTIHLVQGDAAVARAKETLRGLCSRHRIAAVAVGNGTHGRETEAFVRAVLVAEGLTEVPCVPVSEAGASVYSASDVAREEFPDLDLTIRGAISIARRLQDPLAELVKVDPKSIGVGQYQHDVSPTLLARKLDEVVESCVNQVGVELNTASAPLLARVAGIGTYVAKRIVEHRDANGPFKGRRALLEVSGIGAKTFEQAAGFLRVRGGEHPLDASAVHPERYELVERIASDLGVAVRELVGNRAAIERIDPARYEAGDVGSFTLRDIVTELEKPGRDPRSSFEPPKFRDDVRTLEDLKPGMKLEGVVTNVTAFGAFVDVGVHQDGLVHISQLADRFVKTPSDVVKVGDKLEVRVLEVDLARKRISLSARKEGAAHKEGAGRKEGAAPREGAPRSDGAKTGGKGGKPGAPGQGKSKSDGRGDGGGFRHNPFADLRRR